MAWQAWQASDVLTAHSRKTKVTRRNQRTMQVFISYSLKDQAIAKELSSGLSAEGVRVWLAAEEVLPGENLPLEIGKALRRSDALVVLLSPDSVESRGVRSEIAYALSSPKFEGRVVPVIVKPTKDIPWFLQTFPMLRS